MMNVPLPFRSFLAANLCAAALAIAPAARATSPCGTQTTVNCSPLLQGPVEAVAETGACATSIAANDGLHPWITGCTGNPTDGYGIYRWSGSAWVEMTSGKGVQIITTSVDAPVVLSGSGTHSGSIAAGQLYYGEWKGGGTVDWTGIGGPESCNGWSAASTIAGGNYTLYALGCNRDSYGNFDIYSYSGAWSSSLGGTAIDISVAPDGSGLWLDNAAGQQYHNSLQPSWKWTEQSGPIQSTATAAGLNGTAYTTTSPNPASNYYVSYWTGSEWVMSDVPNYGIGGDAQQLSVGTNGTVWQIEYYLIDPGAYYMTPPVEATPPAPLASNSNYVLANPTCALNCTTSCSPLLEVTVSINITADLVGTGVASTSNENPPSGFSFQLNANGANGVSWGSQQYMFLVNTTITAGVESWPTNGHANNNDTVGSPDYDPWPNLTTANTIPAGYTFTYTLTTDSTTGDVVSATFAVDDGQNPHLITYPTYTNHMKKNGFPVAPIWALQLDLVGYGNSAHAQFTQGAGVITYSASSPMSALSGIPSCAYNATTLENSNSLYSVLPSASGSFTQTFSFN